MNPNCSGGSSAFRKGYILRGEEESKQILNNISYSFCPSTLKWQLICNFNTKQLQKSILLNPKSHYANFSRKPKANLNFFSWNEWKRACGHKRALKTEAALQSCSEKKKRMPRIFWSYSFHTKWTFFSWSVKQIPKFVSWCFFEV